MLHKKIESSIRIVDNLLEHVAITGLTISMTLAIIAVFLRYIFGISYSLIDEVCRYSIIYGVFAYVGPLIKKNEHLNMNMLSDKLKGKIMIYNNMLISVIVFLAFIYLFWSGTNWFINLLNMQVKTVSGSMLIAIPAFSVPIGMFLGCIYSLLQVLQDISKLKAPQL